MNTRLLVVAVSLFLTTYPLTAQLTSWQCADSNAVSQDVQLINVLQNLAVVYVDFHDGRVGGINPPTDTTQLSGLNLNAVGSFGWNRENPFSPFYKVVRKYTYEDYWDQFFSVPSPTDPGWTGTRHPDYTSHNGYTNPNLPPNLASSVYRLTLYGSVRDYWSEVSYGNMQILPAPIPGRSGGYKYSTGIVNRIDAANGKNYIRWIHLPLDKVNYGNENTLYPAVRNKLIELHSLPENHEDYISFSITDYETSSGKLAIIGAGSAFGGYAVDDKWFAMCEKMWGNYDQGSTFASIHALAHELGHTIGFGHYQGVGYELMHWGGLNGISYNCPPHVNPWEKIKNRWIHPSNIIHVSSTSTSPISLPPIHNNQTVAVVTLYGEPGRNGEWEKHSEYLIVENRQRLGFNRFTGGETVPLDFSGGALIWHYSSLGTFPISGQVELRLGLKIQNYGGYYGEPPGDPTHFYPYHGEPLNMTSNPNSNSILALPTGISLDFEPQLTGGWVTFVAGYQFGGVPYYNIFLHDGVAEVNDWHDNVYVQRSSINLVHNVAAKTVVDIAPNSLIQPYTSFNAIGTTNEPITFRGIGFGSYRAKWHSLQLIEQQFSSVPQMWYCIFNNAGIGVDIIWGFEVISSSPTIRQCTFSNCNKDISIIGPDDNRYFELAGLDDNNFQSIVIRRNAKLSGADFTIPGNALLTLGVDNVSQGWANLKIVGNQNFNIIGNLILDNDAVVEGKTFNFHNVVNVPINRTLTINSNTTLSFSNSANIFVDGTLLANGTSSNPVLFTGISGQWGSITNGLVPSTITLNYCNISNASTAINVGSWTTLTVSHCNFSFSDIGINIFSAPWAPNPTMQITNNTFSSFPLYSTGISISGHSNILITNNALSGPIVKGTGIYLSASSPQMLSNSIEFWKYGLACVNGSSPLLEEGHNIISNNITGVLCEQANPILGNEVGENTLCLNSYVDVSLRSSKKVYAINDHWSSNENPPGIFEIDGASELIYDPWLEPILNCGGLKGILVEGGKGEKGEGGESMTPVSPIVRQILRERKRGNFVQADGLIRAAIVNNTVPDDVKLWALGQALAVGQRLRGNNLAAFFNSLTTQPPLAREARALLPMSFAYEGLFTQAMAAYDANILQYPNSNLARSGLYGKFSYQLYNRHDTTQARSLLNQLKTSFPQSSEAEMAELQMKSFRSPSAPNRMNGGSGKVASISSSSSAIQLPKQFELAQNYPNPFNPSTTISFALPKDSHVSLKLYDLLGREVQSLVDESLTAGYHQVTFDGSSLATGVYLYRMTSGSFTASKKLLLVK